MTYTYKISESEFIEAMNFRMSKRKKIFQIFLFSIISIIYLYAGINMQWNNELIKPNIVNMIMIFLQNLIIYFIIIYINNYLYKKMAKKQYNQVRGHQEEGTITILEKGINLKSESVEVTLLWDDIHTWEYNDDFYLLHISDYMFHIIPRKIFENKNELNEILNKNIKSIKK